MFPATVCCILRSCLSHIMRLGNPRASLCPGGAQPTDSGRTVGQVHPQQRTCCSTAIRSGFFAMSPATMPLLSSDCLPHAPKAFLLLPMAVSRIPTVAIPCGCWCPCTWLFMTPEQALFAGNMLELALLAGSASALETTVVWQAQQSWYLLFCPGPAPCIHSFQAWQWQPESLYCWFPAPLRPLQSPAPNCAVSNCWPREDWLFSADNCQWTAPRYR